MKARPDHSIALVLLDLTLIVFWPLTQAQFVNYDDPLYVTNCPEVQRGLSWRGVLWAFTTTDAANWHPVTWISHMADVSIWGLTESGHHLTNIILHTASVLLLFFLLYRVTGGLQESALTAALFAWHPLHVESVAWIAERKDVLSAFFWLLAMYAYAAAVQSPTSFVNLLRHKHYGGQGSTSEVGNSDIRSPKRKVFYGLALFFFAR